MILITAVRPTSHYRRTGRRHAPAARALAASMRAIIAVISFRCLQLSSGRPLGLLLRLHGPVAIDGLEHGTLERSLGFLAVELDDLSVSRLAVRPAHQI